VLIPKEKRNKLAARAWKGVFVGYTDESEKLYLVWHPEEKKAFRVRFVQMRPVQGLLSTIYGRWTMTVEICQKKRKLAAGKLPIGRLIKLPKMKPTTEKMILSLPRLWKSQGETIVVMEMEKASKKTPTVTVRVLVHQQLEKTPMGEAPTLTATRTSW
jgi:hypothetical protein